MITDVIAANREACAVGVVFFRSVVYNHAPIRNIVPEVYRHTRFIDEKYFVTAGDLNGHDLSKSPNFFGIVIAVNLAVFRLFN